MKKANKVLAIILAIIGIALIVLYVVFPTQFKECFEYVYSLLNEPLPIIGVSALALGYIALSIVKYIRSTHPSQELREMRESYNQYVAKYEEEKQALKDQNNELKGYIAHICELSTNQKIKNYGKELLGYGREETTNSETKAD